MTLKMLHNVKTVLRMRVSSLSVSSMLSQLSCLYDTMSVQIVLDSAMNTSAFFVKLSLQSFLEKDWLFLQPPRRRASRLNLQQFRERIFLSNLLSSKKHLLVQSKVLSKLLLLTKLVLSSQSTAIDTTSFLILVRLSILFLRSVLLVFAAIPPAPQFPALSQAFLEWKPRCFKCVGLVCLALLPAAIVLQVEAPSTNVS